MADNNEKDKKIKEFTNELAKFEQESEKLKGSYAQCVGIIQYLKTKLNDLDPKWEDKIANKNEGTPA
tara:strand:+ start:814 stop:1014 length:201 start_codon:yes stop_codon:yes gene_type:complete